MILEHRTYAFRPGSVGGWMNKCEREGLPIQKKHLNTFLGLYVSEIGRLHTTVLMWAHDSLADREARRKAMEADPDCRKFIGEVLALGAILTQDVMILNPAPFSPAVVMERA
jgi:NIPSNAP